MDMLKDDRWCFACGAENPHGLHLEDFTVEGDEYVVRFAPRREHQGWQGRAHGGIVATLLDEAMTRLLYDRGDNAVTAEMTVRYHQPVATGAPLTVRARETSRRRRLVETAAELRDEQGQVLASATGKFMLL